MSRQLNTSDGITIISTTPIKLAAPQSPAQINLTPWDLELLLLEYSQKGLLFHQPGPKCETIISHLRETFQRTLHFFPPLAGRLATTTRPDAAATCFHVDCNEGDGALFIHASVDDDNKLTVGEILNPSNNNVPAIVIRSFFPLAGARNRDGVSRPLMAVQVTELVDGLFIGCSINHLLADGTSFWHFFNCWAQISRGEDISKTPFLNRDQLTLDLIGSDRIYISNEHLIDMKRDLSQSPILCDRVFHFTKQSVAKLKARANEEIGEKIGQGKIISSLQAVIAHVWRSIIRCRFNSSKAHATTTFEIPMGARQRLDPPLPKEYFGNSVFPGAVTLETGELLGNGPGWAAWQINRMVAASNGPGNVREFYAGWIEKPEFLQFQGLPMNHFILINSPRFDVYGNDFGWGKPVAVRSGGANRFDGRITVSGGLEEGSLEIEACLDGESLSALGEDDEFMEYVRI